MRTTELQSFIEARIQIKKWMNEARGQRAVFQLRRLPPAHRQLKIVFLNDMCRVALKVCQFAKFWNRQNMF